MHNGTNSVKYESELCAFVARVKTLTNQKQYYRGAESQNVGNESLVRLKLTLAPMLTTSFTAFTHIVVNPDSSAACKKHDEFRKQDALVGRRREKLDMHNTFQRKC